MRKIFGRRNGLNELIEIVLDSWRILAEKISTNRVNVLNEKTLELELAYILKDSKLKVGRQYVVQLSSGTNKTPSGMAEIDLIVTLPDGRDSYSAAIELKYPHNGTTTDYRQQIVDDIYNLEAYVKNGLVNVGFCLAYTTDRYYMDDSRSKVKIGNTGYEPKWLTFNDDQDCFLTVVVD